jgi:hypothetical protein
MKTVWSNGGSVKRAAVAALLSQRNREKVWLWAAYRMPKKLVYWCCIRAIAHATTGQYGTTIVDQISPMDILKRWE